MKKRAMIIILALLLTGVVTSGLVFWKGGDGVSYRTEKIARGDIQAGISATGTLNAVTTVLVGTQVSGILQSIYVDYNSPVKKGQLLARIDPANFEAQLDQAKANLFSAQANVDKSKALLLDAQRSWERNKLLWAKNLISRSDLDTSETNYESAKAQLNASRAQAAQAEAARKIAETNLMYTKIISPVDGIVVSRSVDVGQTVAASFQTPTLFNIARDLTKMQIDTNVDEADIGRIMPGQEAEFSIDAYPGHVFKGKVGQVRIAPQTIQNVVTYDVVVMVDNTDLKLKPGMTANVSILVAKKSGTIKVPNTALRFSPQSGPQSGEDKKARPRESGVWVLENKTPKRIPVVTGITDGVFTELVSGELAEGADVIVDMTGKEKKENNRAPRFF